MFQVFKCFKYTNVSRIQMVGIQIPTILAFFFRKEESFNCQGFSKEISDSKSETYQKKQLVMSKYGYTGGVKRPVDDFMRHDPDGPSLDELRRKHQVHSIVNTVGARIPNPFRIRMVHSCSVLVPTIRKPNHGQSRWFCTKTLFLFLYIKRSRLKRPF